MMDLQGCRPRSISLGSSQINKVHNNYTYYPRQNALDRAGASDGVLQPCDITKIHPRNHDAALSATLKQLDNFIISRNICRHFMLRICTAHDCCYIHDGIFRDCFMLPLFGGAWRDFWKVLEQPSLKSGRINNDLDRDGQNDQESNLVESALSEAQFKKDVLSFEPLNALDVAAGLRLQPVTIATTAHAGTSTEVEAEKSDAQTETNFDEQQEVYTVTESIMPSRAPRRHRKRLHAVRDRMSLWGKGAWRKSGKTKQRKDQNDSEVPITRH